MSQIFQLTKTLIRDKESIENYSIKSTVDIHAAQKMNPKAFFNIKHLISYILRQRLPLLLTNELHCTFMLPRGWQLLLLETILKLDCTTSTFTQKISHNLKHGLKFPERIHANKRKTRCDFDNAFSIMAPSGKTATTSNAGRILEDNLGRFWVRFICPENRRGVPEPRLVRTDYRPKWSCRIRGLQT